MVPFDKRPTFDCWALFDDLEGPFSTKVCFSGSGNPTNRNTQEDCKNKVTVYGTRIDGSFPWFPLDVGHTAFWTREEALVALEGLLKKRKAKLKEELGKIQRLTHQFLSKDGNPKSGCP